ncbi:MAG: DMT family transporter [Pseudomonadota bacterium]
MAGQESDRARTGLGLGLMVAFALFAPLMDALAKLIGESAAVGQIAAVRFVAQSVLLFPLAIVFGWLHRPDRHEMGLHLARAVLLLVATSFFFTALRFMPMADTISIFFVGPFFVLLLGRLFLGETVNARGYIACAVGFSGALFIIQPSFATVGPAALFPLVTAVTFAIYLVLTRQMATRMHPITMQVYTGFAALVLAVPVLWAFDGSGVAPLDPIWPDADTLILLLILGVVATISHVMISFALSMAPASLVAPVQYLEIVSATALGFFIFGDLPGPWTYLGVALIVSAGLYVVAGETKPRRRRVTGR